MKVDQATIHSAPRFEGQEVELRLVILRLITYVRYLWNKKWIVGGVALVAAIVWGYVTWKRPITYTSEITFVVGGEGGGGGSAASILGQFGLGGTSEYNLEKIVSLARSRRITEGALTDSSHSPLLIDEIIEVYDLEKEWEDNELFQRYLQGERDSLVWSAVLKNVTSLVTGTPSTEGLGSYGYNEDSGILELEVTSESPELSINLNREIYEHLEDYYTRQQRSQPAKNLRIVSMRADSVARELRKVDAAIAGRRDSRQGLYGARSSTVLQDLERQRTVLSVMYAEVVKNRETASFMLASETPVFDMVDYTRMPISPNKASIVMGVLKGAIFGGFVIVFILALRFFLISILKSS